MILRKIVAYNQFRNNQIKNLTEILNDLIDD